MLKQKRGPAFRGTDKENARQKRTARLAVAVLLAASNLWWASCASVRHQTTSMAEVPEVTVTADELRVRAYEFQNRFAAVVQTTADEIIDREHDLAIQESALRWKVNAIPAMEKAVFRADPLVGMADAWVLTIAMAQYLDQGAGEELFGSSQVLAVDAASRLESEIDATARSLLGSAAAARVRQEFEQFVRENPIEDLNFGRRSAMTDEAAVSAAGLRAGGLQAVGQIDATARDLSERLTVYFERLPKQIRWNAELVVIEVMRKFGNPLVADIGSIEESAAGVRSFLDGTPDLISSERETILRAMREETGSTLQLVDQQRAETLDALQGEREIVLQTLQAELDAGLAALREERIQVLAGLDELAQQTLASTQNAESLIDRLFWRGFFLLLIAFGLGLAFRFVDRFVNRGNQASR